MIELNARHSERSKDSLGHPVTLDVMAMSLFLPSNNRLSNDT